MRKNYVFSNTRQWNPGDEIILLGIQNILNELRDPPFNPIIFNRNPDLRSGFDGAELVEGSDSFFDNSLKPDTDCSIVDWAIFAGTPEWCNVRNHDLYANIRKNNIPVMILGVGGGFNLYKESFREIIGKAKAFTVRDADTLSAVAAQGFHARQLPCPALLSALKEKEKKITDVKNIGLIFQISQNQSPFWASLSQEAYDYEIEIYNKIINRYDKEFKLSVICHYIDEVAPATRIFPDNEIFYSYNSSDYHDIYYNFDFVIGPRVHGIGTAASMGIPGVAIAHDARGKTSAGFLADIIDIGADSDIVFKAIDAGVKDVMRRNNALFSHKAATLKAYLNIVSAALEDPCVRYDGREDQRADKTARSSTYHLSERLDRTDAALTAAQRLAIERFHEAEALRHRLDRTDAALAEAQNLAVERAGEIERLRDRLGQSDSALAEAQRLAILRLAEIGRLEEKADSSLLQAGLARQQANQLQEEADRLQELADRLETENRLAQGEGDLQRARAAAAEAALAALYRSRSWRLLAPARAIAAMLGRRARPRNRLP